MTSPRIKTAVLFLSIASLQAAAFTFVPLNTARAQDAAASVTVTFSGIQTQTGAIMAGVYDSEAAFAGGPPLQGVRIAVTVKE